MMTAMPRKSKLPPYVRPGMHRDEPQDMPDSAIMLRIALHWRDSVHHGTLEERQGMTNGHMQAHFRGDIVSQTEMDAICEAANTFYERVGLPQRITNKAGEFLPYTEGETR
jgi:hypothetical protein